MCKGLVEGFQNAGMMVMYFYHQNSIGELVYYLIKDYDQII